MPPLKRLPTYEPLFTVTKVYFHYQVYAGANMSFITYTAGVQQIQKYKNNRHFVSVNNLSCIETKRKKSQQKCKKQKHKNTQTWHNTNILGSHKVTNTQKQFSTEKKQDPKGPNCVKGNATQRRHFYGKRKQI